MTDLASRRPLSEWARSPAVPNAAGRPSTRPLRPAGPNRSATNTRSTARSPSATDVSRPRVGTIPAAGRVQPSGASAAAALAPRRHPEVEHPEVERPEVGAPRHLRVVGRRPRFAAARRRQARVLVIAGSLVAICVAFGLVYLHVLSAQKQFELNHLTAREQVAQTNYQHLRVAVEADNSPARIMSAAENLGMRAPLHVTFVKGVTGGVLAPAASVAGSQSLAPGGVADWSHDKPNLAGAP